MTPDNPSTPAAVLKALADVVDEADLLEASGVFPPPSLEAALDRARKVVYAAR